MAVAQTRAWGLYWEQFDILKTRVFIGHRVILDLRYQFTIYNYLKKKKKKNYKNGHLEPTSSAAPRFASDSTLSNAKKFFGRPMTLLCPAQAYPAPSFRYTHCPIAILSQHPIVSSRLVRSLFFEIRRDLFKEKLFAIWWWQNRLVVQRHVSPPIRPFPVREKLWDVR